MQSFENNTLESLSRKHYKTEDRPISILQFGEGNFLRTFVDNFIQILNDKDLINMNVAVVQPIPFGRVANMKEQDGLYTIFLEGLDQGQIVKEHQVIDVVSDFINPYTELDKYLSYARSSDMKIVFSNTTEAGIVFEAEDITYTKTPNSFPAKLLQFLKHRYDEFEGDTTKGLEIVPCELIDNNGTALKEVLVKLANYNNLGDEFMNWLVNHNRFYNTLVDRIVPGYPRDTAQALEETLGYKDHSMVKGEVFHLWVIEGPEALSHLLPFDQSGLNVYYVNSIKPYKQRKVKILNGSHTALVPVAYLMGFRAVRESITNPLLEQFIQGFIFDEVVPTIDLPRDEMKKFADSVLERYANPFIHHLLMSISLNSMAKFKSRILPTIMDLDQKNIFPYHALFSLAATIVFFRGIDSNGEKIMLQDEDKFLTLFDSLWATNDISHVVQTVLNLDHWETDVLKNEKVVKYVTNLVTLMVEKGMNFALNQLIRGEE